MASRAPSASLMDLSVSPSVLHRRHSKGTINHRSTARPGIGPRLRVVCPVASTHNRQEGPRAHHNGFKPMADTVGQSGVCLAVSHL